MLFWKKKKNLEASTENNNSQETPKEEEKIDVSMEEVKDYYANEEVIVQKSSTSKKAPAKKTSTKKKSTKKASSSKKKSAKKTSSSKSGGSNRNIYHVSPRKDKAGKKIGWEVKLEGSKKVTSFCKTKDEAISKVKLFASNKGATIMIKKADGSHQETIRL